MGDLSIDTHGCACMFLAGSSGRRFKHSYRVELWGNGYLSPSKGEEFMHGTSGGLLDLGREDWAVPLLSRRVCLVH